MVSAAILNRAPAAFLPLEPSLNSNRLNRKSRTKNAEKPPFQAIFLPKVVGVRGLEPRASCSQSRRATNCATPRYEVVKLSGRFLPNHAFYQLNYTRIFNFCHDTTANGKNKVFSVCGQTCGQSRFCTAFSNRRKSRKCRCRKALRRFVMPHPGYSHGTPKPGAIPASLYPDMRVSADKHSAIIAKAAGECKHFLILKKN